ncbi:DUF3047 domain-containing protein [Sulfurifustis variabilis]|nr:DUF3047 domain-containing protein [Sulfurifustis variabilis]
MRLMIAMALIAATGLAADARVTVGAFSRGELDGWEEKQFKGRTEYRPNEIAGTRALAAHSREAASGLYKRVRIDLAQTPYLHWSWRIERTLGDLDETTRAGDDYAARVYVVVSGGVFFWNTRAVNYVWASRLPQGATWPNAFTANARMIAVRSGDALAGRWVNERRDVREDFKALFGMDVRHIDAVAIMTDTDNSGGEARAYYGDIYFDADGSGGPLARLIVRFAPGVDPNSAEALSAVGRAVHAEIEYVRPLSAGAHVLRVRATDGASPDELRRRLRERPEILQAEPDRTLRGG